MTLTAHQQKMKTSRGQGLGAWKNFPIGHFFTTHSSLTTNHYF